MVSRVYVEKKPGFDVQAQQLLHELQTILGMSSITGLRIINRYDVEGISDDLFAQCVPTVFSEPQSDNAFYEVPAVDADQALFAVEYLPGQFDQRADSASECVQLISQGNRPDVRSATLYMVQGELSDSAVQTIKHYVINPIEAREASLEERSTLHTDYPVPADVEIIEGFTNLDAAGLQQLIDERGLAMDLADIEFCQKYFRDDEQRDPTITEVKMIDTYWSDHCRHTTFGTVLDSVSFDDDDVRAAYEAFRAYKDELGRSAKPECLMEMGTIGARLLKARGILKNLDESEEINACTVKCKVDVDGQWQDWLYLFKNETHNHPTEIEPFGGAATCVGGAIRDPLSGRSYVYQAMRITGAADPTVPVSQTLAGKLPQRKLVTTAAAGFSSYGNQIGLTTGQVHELYHPGYAAKRMEIGAVVGATPANHVRRETPAPGDVIVLLGGRTGRDGIGGATGSSKAHGMESLEECGAEVQKGNAPVERKIQRLFRNGEACRMIKRCNDFGAGGVSVAIGELADGVSVNLDVVPKKYEGLDGTELAIAESQERMAVALAPEDADAFCALAAAENLEATPVATVTQEARVVMKWRGTSIVDVSRDFLNTNGAAKHATVHVQAGRDWHSSWPGSTVEDRLMAMVKDINVCSNKGLSERFDSTIGAATVLMPFGGKNQLTPSMAMMAKFPVKGETTTCSGMAWGFNPYLSEANPYKGAYLAVLDSICKLIAAGFKREDAYLTFQEYFEKLRDVPERWGKPVASVLGALKAQIDFGVGSIGGKDSMSGSFEKLDVPPTLVSFATAVGSLDRATSPEFKEAGHRVVRIAPRYESDCLMPAENSAVAVMDTIEQLISAKAAKAVSVIGYGCGAEALFKMCVGNGIGVNMNEIKDSSQLFTDDYGAFLVELADGANVPAATDNVVVEPLGVTTADYTWQVDGQTIDLAVVQEAWESGIEGVFPYRSNKQDIKDAGDVPTISSASQDRASYSGPALLGVEPRVVIPVFPGTNCEYDTARAFRRAGAEPTTLVVNNLSPQAVAQSAEALVAEIKRSQIIMLPGGFSGGDEPDGSAKFITAFFRSPAVTEAVRDLLQNRDGLMLGICNGFQALVKLGLVPFGDIRPMDEDCPTLTFNSIGRHQSRLVRTRVASNQSPWLSRCNVGDIHTVAISNGEGRFVAPHAVLQNLADNGQIATQYVDQAGAPSMDLADNPSTSMWAIEGITSPDGRVMGKMGHSERAANGLYQNVSGNLFQPIIEGGVDYFN